MRLVLRLLRLRTAPGTEIEASDKRRYSGNGSSVDVSRRLGINASRVEQGMRILSHRTVTMRLSEPEPEVHWQTDHRD
eukprot:1026448-Rhodomonas_salina.1